MLGPQDQNSFPQQQPAFHAPPAGGHNDGPAMFGMDQFVDNPMAQAGLHSAQHLFGSVTKNFDSSLSKWVDIQNLKYYFHVNNSYVLNKLMLLLFPFRHPNWERRLVRSEDMHLSGGMEQPRHALFHPPRDDINAPDLYIPTMGFVTYILLCAFILGVQNQFTPEVLGMTASSAFAALAFEVCVIKMGFYLLNVRVEIPVLDCVAYSGYKFFGLILSVFIGVFVVGTGYSFLCGALMAAPMAYFMVKTLGALMGRGGGPSRKYFLIAVAVLQVLLMSIMAAA